MKNERCNPLQMKVGRMATLKEDEIDLHTFSNKLSLFNLKAATLLKVSNVLYLFSLI